VPGMIRKAEEKTTEEKKKPEISAHVQTFDPENPPFSTHRLCIYLRELEEEKEHK
jgi:hypothetical protein